MKPPRRFLRKLPRSGAVHEFPPRDDGLAFCRVCQGLESALLKTCPGVPLTLDECDLISQFRDIVHGLTIAEYNERAGDYNDAILDRYLQSEYAGALQARRAKL